MSIYVFFGNALWSGSVVENIAVVVAESVDCAKNILIQRGMDLRMVEMADVVKKPVLDGLVFVSNNEGISEPRSWL